MANTPAYGGTGKRPASSSELGGTQRVEKKQRRQQPVTRVNELVPLTSLSTLLNPPKNMEFEGFQDTPAPVPKTQREIHAYLDKQWLEVKHEYYQELVYRGEEQRLEATQCYTFADIEEEQRRKNLRKKSIDQSTAVDWAEWSNDELRDVVNMHSVFPVPNAQSREKLLEAIKLLFIRRQLDDDVAGIMADDRLSLKMIENIDSNGPWPQTVVGDSFGKFDFEWQPMSPTANFTDSELAGLIIPLPRADISFSQISGLAQDESSRAENIELTGLLEDCSLPSTPQTWLFDIPTTPPTPVRRQSKYTPVLSLRSSPALSHGSSANSSTTIILPIHNECLTDQSHGPQSPPSPSRNGVNTQRGGPPMPSASHSPREAYQQKKTAEMVTEKDYRIHQEEMISIQQMQEEAARSRHEILVRQEQKKRTAQSNGGFQTDPSKLEHLVDLTAHISSSQNVGLEFFPPNSSPSLNAANESSRRRMDSGLDNARSASDMTASPRRSNDDSVWRLSDGPLDSMQLHADSISTRSHAQRRTAGELLRYISLPKAEGDVQGQGLLHAEPQRFAQDFVPHIKQVYQSAGNPVFPSPDVHDNVMQDTDSLNSLFSSQQIQQFDGFNSLISPMQSQRTSGYNTQVSPKREAFQQSIARSPYGEKIHTSSQIAYGEGSPSRGSKSTNLLQSTPGAMGMEFFGLHGMPEEIGSHYAHRIAQLPLISPTAQRILCPQYQGGRPTQHHMRDAYGQMNPNRQQLQQNLQYGHFQTSPQQHIQRSLQSTQGQVSPSRLQPHRTQMISTYHSPPLLQEQQQLNFDQQQRLSLAQQQQSMWDSGLQQHSPSQICEQLHQNHFASTPVHVDDSAMSRNQGPVPPSLGPSPFFPPLTTHQCLVSGAQQEDEDEWIPDSGL
jgi:hypothetical protein